MNKAIRRELLEGVTIEEVLLKYRLNFQELWDMFKYYDNPNSKIDNKPYHNYILERNGSFAVRKSINGKTKIFGVYNSLADAILMRDCFEKDGWKQRNVDRLCDEMGIERRKGHPNCHVHYS